MKSAAHTDYKQQNSRVIPCPRMHAQAERDCPVLVNTCSEAARSFYLRNGFSEVGAQPVMIGGRQHWWMAFPAQSPATSSHDAVLSHDDVPVKLTLQLAEAGSPGVPPLR